MKNQMRWSVLVVAMMGALWLVGCGQKQSESSAPPATTGEAAEPEASGEKITPAETADAIWGQIAQEQTKLSAAIQNGQLKDVHHLAFGIRDLVVALANKASAASPASAGQLKGLVEQVEASASKLDELGDAGNVSGTQTEAARLNTLLDAVKTLTAGK